MVLLYHHRTQHRHQHHHQQQQHHHHQWHIEKGRSSDQSERDDGCELARFMPRVQSGDREMLTELRTGNGGSDGKLRRIDGKPVCGVCKHSQTHKLSASGADSKRRTKISTTFLPI